jgi:N-acetylglucosaminyl-diphospho-decaprenol L-rhamnosyltransferase
VNAPRVAVVVVTYNSADVLAQCLASLRGGGADGVELTDVVVVDNASSDSSTEIAKATCGLPISVVQLTENTGYAAGVNAGVTSLRTRRPEAVMVLNPDCRLRPGALATLAQALRTPGRGIVAPRLVNLDGSLQPTLRRLPTVLGAFAEAILGGRIADRLGFGELIFSDGAHESAGPAAWVTGAALLIAWALLESVGPWDERFLLYSEETEFMLRASDRGWSTWYEPAAVVEHKGGDSGTRPGLAALLTVNKVTLFRRRHGAVSGLFYSCGVLLGTLLRAVAGQRTARASVAALLFPSHRITSLAELR